MLKYHQKHNLNLDPRSKGGPIFPWANGSLVTYVGQTLLNEKCYVFYKISYIYWVQYPLNNDLKGPK